MIRERELICFESVKVIIYYQHDQLGSGGHTQKAKLVRGVYLKPRSLRNTWPNKLRYRKSIKEALNFILKFHDGIFLCKAMYK